MIEKARRGVAIAAPRQPRACRVGLLLALACAALAASACGDEQKRPAGALEAALSFFPPDTGVAVSVSTDGSPGAPLKRLGRLGSRLPRWPATERRIRSALGDAGVDVDGPLRDQLGNPIVLAVNKQGRALLAIRVQDGGALRATIERRIDSGSVEEADAEGDAFGWRDRPRLTQGFGYFALLGDDLVAAQSRDDLAAAIGAAGDDDDLAANEAAVRSLRRLDGATLARLWGDARRVLGSADGDPTGVRRLPWVRALGDLEGALTVGRVALRLELRAHSNRAPLTSKDLPIAPGARPPRVHDSSAATVIALRQPDQTVRFLEPVLGAVDPERYGRYREGLAAVSSLLGIDLHEDLLSRVTNLSIAASGARKLEFVATLERGAGDRFAASLETARIFVEGVLREVVPGAVVETQEFGSTPTWVVKTGRITVARYGVRGDALVGSVGMGRLPVPRRGRPARTVGALSIAASPERIASLLGPLGVVFGQAVLGEAIGLLSGLGDLTLGVRAETRALTARGRLVPGDR